MKRLIALLALAVGVGFSSAPATAQGGVVPGVGTQRGIQELNNSGQAGFVTLFNSGPRMRFVTSFPDVRNVEAVTLQRGRGCDRIEPGIVARLGNLVHGISRGFVPLPEGRLLSGNYVVVVYSNTGPGARRVACGWLYR